MAQHLKDIKQAAHFWANHVQPTGEAGSLSFYGTVLKSYRATIARFLSADTVLITKRNYSPTTQRHISLARDASSQYTQVFAHDLADGARDNMKAARHTIMDVLASSERKGIRQTTRDALKAQALREAEQANAYLAALPEDERQGETPIDTDNLEAVRAGMLAAEQAAKNVLEDQRKARIAGLADKLAKWRTGEILQSSGLYELPTALRIGQGSGWVPVVEERGVDPAIQTTKGAEIPVADAIRLWPVIQRVKESGHDFELSHRLGHYTLTLIRADGSIVVGCHDIAYSELELMAKALKLI